MTFAVVYHENLYRLILHSYTHDVTDAIERITGQRRRTCTGGGYWPTQECKMTTWPVWREPKSNGLSLPPQYVHCITKIRPQVSRKLIMKVILIDCPHVITQVEGLVYYGCYHCYTVEQNCRSWYYRSWSAWRKIHRALSRERATLYHRGAITNRCAYLGNEIHRQIDMCYVSDNLIRMIHARQSGKVEDYYISISALSTWVDEPLVAYGRGMKLYIDIHFLTCFREIVSHRIWFIGSIESYFILKNW